MLNRFETDIAINYAIENATLSDVISSSKNRLYIEAHFDIDSIVLGGKYCTCSNITNLADLRLTIGEGFTYYAEISPVREESNGSTTPFDWTYFPITRDQYDILMDKLIRFSIGD